MPAARARRASEAGATSTILESHAGKRAATPAPWLVPVMPPIGYWSRCGRHVLEFARLIPISIEAYAASPAAARSPGSAYARGTASRSRGNAVAASCNVRALEARDAAVSTACAIASKPAAAMTDGGAPTTSSGSTIASRAATPGPRMPRFRPLAGSLTIAPWLTSAPEPAVVGSAITAMPGSSHALAGEQRVETITRRDQRRGLREIERAPTTHGDDAVRPGRAQLVGQRLHGVALRLAMRDGPGDHADPGLGQQRLDLPSAWTIRDCPADDERGPPAVARRDRPDLAPAARAEPDPGRQRELERRRARAHRFSLCASSVRSTWPWCASRASRSTNTSRSRA